ncbi:uncharacterized protein PG998_007292 [Apiospora kogelbergensis]|uniref:uncharacterized protein n=1 Tax=Apiospora kogelbergensis TaxID=1337665 RepID=UPI00312FC5FA
MDIAAQGQTKTPETEAPMTIAGFNTMVLSVAATLCGLFAIVTLSVRHVRHEARQTLLRLMRLVGFAFAYGVIGLVYVPIRVLDCASRAWPSSYSEDEAVDEYDDEGEEGEGGGAWPGKGGARSNGYGYEDEFCRTGQGWLATERQHYPAATSSTFTRSNSEVSDINLNEASDLEKGVSSPTRNKTKPC